MTNTVQQNQVQEWTFHSSSPYNNAYTDVQLHAVFTAPNGNERTIPLFWNGRLEWKLRYSSAVTGTHQFRTVCSDTTNDSLHDVRGSIDITDYTGTNPLYLHGSAKAALAQSYLQHADGTPFFWLADTWWMAFTKRLSLDEFDLLVNDRVDKGFTTIQIIAGLYPDMDPLDERGANENGVPWDTSFSQINPAYFDLVDLKLQRLVEAGLMPCLVGSWGFFLQFAGKELIIKHWDYLVARYAAYPLMWCIAGEADMPFYLSEEWHNAEKKEVYIEYTRDVWTDVLLYVKSIDAFERGVTIHPTQFGHNMVNDASLLDLDMLQTGHGSILSLENTVKFMQQSVAREPRIPVINSEINYEGIGGSSYADIQRFTFWSSFMSGACGHTYGATGIWQVNGKDKPYGPSPHGLSWGSTSWQEAYQLPGSYQVGLGKKLLSKYDWWQFETKPEWIHSHYDYDSHLRPYAAGIAGQVRIYFLPFPANWDCLTGYWIGGIESDTAYKASFFDPVTGDTRDVGLVQADDNGNWKSPHATIFQDWILILERV